MSNPAFIALSGANVGLLPLVSTQGASIPLARKRRKLTAVQFVIATIAVVLGATLALLAKNFLSATICAVLASVSLTLSLFLAIRLSLSPTYDDAYDEVQPEIATLSSGLWFNEYIARSNED